MGNASNAITLLSDPNGWYAEGASFSTYEFAFSTIWGSWLDGMRFHISRDKEEDFEAIIVGGVPVSLRDGRHLEAKRSGAHRWRGGAYKWTAPSLDIGR